MKKLFFVIAVLFASVTVKAQLAHTKWKDTLKLDNPIEVIFAFAKDTVVVTTVADGSLVETMTYKVEGSVFTIKKINGQSDCDATTLGKYKFAIKGKQMLVTLVSDACTDRSSVLDKTTLVRMR